MIPDIRKVLRKQIAQSKIFQELLLHNYEDKKFEIIYLLKFQNIILIKIINVFN